MFSNSGIESNIIEWNGNWLKSIDPIHADYRAYITERNVRNEIRISQLQITES